MSVQVENMEKNMAKLTITVPAEEFAAAITKAYNKNKGQFNIPGFRKGKVPQAMVEKMYGAAVFYEEAANIVMPEAYEAAVDGTDLEIVSRPEIDVTQMEKGKDFIFTATVAVKPSVTLGQYKGIEVEKQTVEVTEEDIDAEVKKAQEQNAREVVVERAAQNGDTVMIDYSGSVEGVLFDGGTAENQPLVLGSGSFIPGFEEQLAGKAAGEETDVNVTFPEEYHAPELAGKAAVFKVNVNEVKAKELPEADDEFAQDVSEFDTIAEYREDIKKQLIDQKTVAADNAKKQAVMDKIIENAQMDIPEAMVMTQAEQMVDEYAQRLQYQGLSLEQYFQFTGLNHQTLLEQMKPQALKNIQSRLVLEAVVDAEKIEASDEDLEKELEGMAAAYNMELDKIHELIGDAEKANIKKDLAAQKAVDFVAEQAVEA